ncbi:SDR family NAD(P)-dependent oxidoreductase [Clostridium estertheticum]|uniref:SDR family NAD(P)-dependent oxidoreductase n=1 Tax=Clostridium estertheticum TaxID=238834 RepID=UPI001CF37F7C|nr:SDR family NAD(P)-dependent oxidoreductase [Clostridium estertheticum]MCB2360150.1 SDR family NAD(P)-dependent oxidoreductase [Clostridium estertheticum]
MKDLFLISINHPIIKNHKAYGQELLPGLAYIDMLYQIFRENGYDFSELELRDISIYNPLIVTKDYSVMISINCLEVKAGQWDIIVEGQEKHGENLVQNKKRYVTAKMNKIEHIKFKEKLNIKEIKETNEKIVSIDDVYEQYRNQELVHTSLMKAEGNIYEIESGVIVDIAIGNDGIDTADLTMFHPTLLDGSGVGAGVLFSTLVKDDEKLFLPIFYESFRAEKLLQNKCFTRVQKSSVKRKNELIYITMEFFNEIGEKVAELKNFANKLVRGDELINPKRKEVSDVNKDCEKTSTNAESKKIHPALVKKDREDITFEVELFLKELLANRINKDISQIETHIGYYEMGLDSQGLLEVVKGIEAKIGASISPTLLFEYTNIKEAADYLIEAYGEKFGKEDEEKITTEEIKYSIETSESNLNNSTHLQEEDIAIIGIAGRYPEADNIDEFWENLKLGKDCISEVQKSRWDWRKFENIKSPTGKDISRWGGFINNYDCFDPQFFRISPREAELMDPQERLFLETCWEAIEDSGYTPKNIVLPREGNNTREIGVFVGVMHKDYTLVGAELVTKGQVVPLSLNYAPIANRVSYFCNFNGPSMAVDTVCSSSLTAVHLAMESIKRGECQVAIAGGVNLSLHPNKYITYGLANMHSSDGYCHTFGKDGDGYVSGEGVGAVILKPLSKAEKDHDHIYAVIKGSSINHCGAVSGITVPSPKVQANLIINCLEKTGINPKTISYMEAHGTGTSLGDPIEIQGLVKAFSQYTKEKGFCSIGSVKSNIGHAEAAAGISGLTKVALQLHYKTLVPSLHSEELNPYIDFEKSPFHIQHKVEEWKQPVEIKENNKLFYPRRAGLSAFGATGSNAHIILEEYMPKDNEQRKNVFEKNKSVIVPLSARNKERLNVYAKKLIEFLRSKPFINIADLAYTLQLGREAMEERVTFIVLDSSDLINKLEVFVEGSINLEGFYRGKVSNNKEEMKYLIKNDDTYESLINWIKSGTFSKVAELWTKGFELDWELLYDEFKPQRTSLPTYPFAKERYWIPKVANYGNSVSADNFKMMQLHPLLHQNTSDFYKQKFTSVFTGDEFFLKGHLVKGQRILPGVAYLEMALTAVALATGIKKEEIYRVSLKDIIWIRPIVVAEQNVSVDIGLSFEDNGKITYEIYSESKENVEENIIYSQGLATIETVSNSPSIDINTIYDECKYNALNPSKIYETYKSVGIEYGLEYKCIEELYIGEDKVLAKLALPSVIANTGGEFILHPSLMDSAVHASLALVMASTENSTSRKPSLAFALKDVQIFNNCDSAIWSLIRYSKDNKIGDNIQKLDIDIMDQHGNVCVSLSGFSSRVLDTDISTNIIDKSHEKSNLMAPVWDLVSIEELNKNPKQIDEVVVIGGNQENSAAIKSKYTNARFADIRGDDTIESIVKKLKIFSEINCIIWIANDKEIYSIKDEALIEKQNEGVIMIFRIIKALLILGYGEKHISWSLVTLKVNPIHQNDSIRVTDGSIHGLIGTMTKEYPNWKVRVIDVDDCDKLPVTDIFNIPLDNEANPWVYRKNQWYRQKLIKVNSIQSKSTLYNAKGVYVVIGGAGGIGEIWTEYIIRKYKSKVIWIGRKPINSTIQAKLDRISELGITPDYISADASNRESLQKAYEEIKKKYHKINGVIHSAIGSLDQSLLKMEEELFRNGLLSKIDVSVRIAQVFSEEALDFVMFFSSIASFGKAPGQSSYVAGCTFKDLFAHQLSQEWDCAVKVINWGYWGDIGIGNAIPNTLKNRMLQSGIREIDHEDAMNILESLLVSNVNQMVVMNKSKDITYEDDIITVLPKEIDSYSEHIGKYVAKDGIDIRNMKLEEGNIIQEIEEISCKLLIVQLKSVGIFDDNNEFIIDNKAKLELHHVYRRWVEESLNVLESKKHITREGNVYALLDTSLVSMDELWTEWNNKKGTWTKNPNIKAHVYLIQETLASLDKILTGKIPATDIVFPNSSMELVEGIYKNNLVSDHFNEVLCDAIILYIKERIRKEPSTKIRIIEIGAGTGGTSEIVFKNLYPYASSINEYCYTDISKAFLMHAEKVFGPENPYLTYKIFNVEEEIIGQNINLGVYDIVIATNVLHATKNIYRTMRNTKSLLKNNGLIFVNEISENSLFTHLTFGLLEGWWLYEDEILRIPGCPGLYPEDWKIVLEKEGFKDILFLAEKDHDLGHQLIVAESDGVVRQSNNNKNKSYLINNKGKDSILKENVQEKPQSGINKELLLEKTIALLKKLVGDTLKISSEKIDASEPLEIYGIDSILVVHLTNALKEIITDISSTIFFEYQTINALAQHFIDTQKNTLINRFGLEQNLNKEQALNKDQKQDKNINPKLLSKDRFFKLQIPEVVVQESKVLDDPIAIIGMSGRYPKAKNVNEFWSNLELGRDCITEIPKNRWSLEDFYDHNPEEAVEKGKSYSKWGGFLDEFDKFDPLFFNISPKEAINIDPQERLFVQCCWSVLEDAGYTRDQLSKEFNKNVGVFAGITRVGFNLYGPALWRNDKKLFPHTSFSSVANRVSYLLNLQGPSMPIDTACSSSITAIHEACEHIHRGECEMAIAGGVNLYLHPSSYKQLCGLQMLSTDGKCKSFGKGANGFVPGEGVGAILLKPLSKAIKDKDNIYAVIKGTSINHGGKTNGYTVPNPVAQGELIKSALERAGVDARTVSYIEAHGTGTELGDPIEIAGLTRAFRDDTEENGFCALGSVKSNVGHMEAAAGIAGVTKILLQMKNRKIAPSLNAKELNPNINFEKTPFFLQQELSEWKRPVIKVNGENKEYPRIAGISAFGAGGSNAHLVIEEYMPEEIEVKNKNNISSVERIIVLSAKDQERLKDLARQLLLAIGQQGYSNDNLANIAYTLQVGREAMGIRIAMVVTSIKELEEKLQTFIDGAKEIDNFYHGEVKANKKILSVFTADEDMGKTVTIWAKKGKYSKILELWVNGFTFDWNKLYDNKKLGRISLPTYPFAKESYWIDVIGDEVSINNKDASYMSQVIHPLVHSNTSNLHVQKFSSTFSGEEFFLSDYLAKGNKILPGTIYLEMARVAVEKSLEEIKENSSNVKLREVVWSSPILLDHKPISLNVAVFPNDNGEILYEIYGSYENSDLDKVVYNQGIVSLGQSSKPLNINLKEIKGRCNNTISSKECYDQLRNIHGDYGVTKQGISNLYIGHNEGLASISLHSSISNSKDKFILHPVILEEAIQAAVLTILVTKDNENTHILNPILPFKLQELEIFDTCSLNNMWAYISFNNRSKLDISSQEKTLNIDICDDIGKVCVSINGLSLIEAGEHKGLKEAIVDTSTVFLEPSWQENDIALESSPNKYSHTLVILCDPDGITNEKIEKNIGGATSIILNSDVKEIDKRFKSYFIQVFEQIQKIINEKPTGNVFIQVVVDSTGEQEVFVGLSGMLKTLMLENPKFIGQVVKIDSWSNVEKTIERLKSNIRFSVDNLVTYKKDKRYVGIWSEVQIAKNEITTCWKDEGVYLITGGIGGLGLIFTKEIAENTKSATLILVGRSSIRPERRKIIEDLRAMGTRVEYRMVDISSEEAVVNLIASIKSEFGGIQGIIHSAGIVKDNFIVKKTINEIDQVFGPKVTGLINIDNATKDLELDFFVLFSSGAGAIGNIGQADYAAANAFMDAYAKYRNALVNLNQCSGRTISINWPLWNDGGMRVNEETEKNMKLSLGIMPMSTIHGIEAFYKALASRRDQILVLEGDASTIRENLLPLLDNYDSDLFNKIKSETMEILSGILDVNINDLDPESDFNEYGLDLVMLTEFFNSLNKKYKLEINSSTFHEYKNLNMIIKYLMRKSATTSTITNNSKMNIEKNIRQVDNEVLMEKTQSQLKLIFGEITTLSADRINDDEELEKYGIDSIMIMQLNKKLAKVFGKLSKTLFYEYNTLRALSEYLVKNYTEECIKWTKLEEQILTTSEEPVVKIDLQKGFPLLKPFRTTKTNRLSFNYDAKYSKSISEDSIAIVGISGRYPQSKDVKEFWLNLESGKSCITEIPEDRWPLDDFYNSDFHEALSKGKSYSKWGGFIENFADFAPQFFNISPIEAINMDPQEKLFIETCWEVLEDAGYTRNEISKEYNKKVGVFAGITKTGFDLYGPDLWRKGENVFPHTSFASLANRVSYILNLQGPSMTIDTMCSSSLVAIHEACEHIRSGQCEMAIAGGVNLYLHSANYNQLCRLQMLSKDEKCKSFGAEADGFVPGEGVGAILLKPLSKAIKDKDIIYGVIRGTNINHGGKTSGYTVPNPTAQGELIRETLDKAGVNARAVSYIEAHGTGTELGDPIEVTGLTNAFRKDTNDIGFCSIGSVKSNIGHLEAAAGIASITKVLLQMKYKKIVPSLNAKELNPNINFDDTPFYVQQELRDWDRPIVEINGQVKEFSRIAGISSFGAGGANAHIIIEEYILGEKDTDIVSSVSARPSIIVMSAKNKKTLKEKAFQLISAIKEQKLTDTDLPSIMYTLQLGRESMEARLGVIVNSIEELILKLNEFINGNENIIDFYKGEVKHNKNMLPIFADDAEMDKIFSNWINKNKYSKLLQSWVNGMSFDWNKLYDYKKLQKISLPTYPFERQRYWMPKEIHLRDDVTYYDNIEIDSTNELEEIVETKSKDSCESIQERLVDTVEGKLKKFIEEVTQIPERSLDIESSFQDLGLDSIMIYHLNEKIDKYVGKLDATLFFKYNNVHDLAVHLAKTYPDKLSGLENKALKKKGEVHIDDFVRRDNQYHSSTQSFCSTGNTDIAIIGVAGLYPKATTLEEFWKNLYDGVDCIEEIPENRWPLKGFYEPDRAKAIANGLSYSKWGGFLDNVDCFDPLFFNIAPKDAIFMDPQERLFLQVAWKCIEDSGYTRETLKRDGYGNRIGVFVGSTYNNYQLYMAEAARKANQDMFVANSQIFSIANRVSYVMNFTGPSLTIDTACSSSLYALHLACESICSGQSSMAIAGGVNLSIHPSKYITLCQGQFNSSDGKCRAFCEGGTGYVPAEAVGAVMLKPLKDAIRDKDNIYGIVKSTAVSHAGKTNGYTVPSPVSQSLAIEEALKRAKIHPQTISCIEAHGTGTVLGDPIEITGLTDVFKKYTSDTGFCSISSVKTNIGHAEAASGMAQLTKVLLQLKHKTLVKNLMHGENLNPNINFSETPFVVQTENEYWKPTLIDGYEVPRRAGISSFGAGGANAHVIIEEYIPKNNDDNEDNNKFGKQAIIVLSAKNEERLKEQAEQLLKAIEVNKLTDEDLPNVAYTLQVGRENMNERLAIIVESMEELLEKFMGFIEGTINKNDIYVGNFKKNKENLSLFIGDEDLQGVIESWIVKGKYAKVLDLWAKGLSVDWSLLYGQHKPIRISLPTYPFVKESYWISQNKGKVENNCDTDLLYHEENIVEKEPKVKADYEIMSFEEVWEEQPLESYCSNEIKTVVCFLSDIKNHEAITSELKMRNSETRIIFVTQGSNYQKNNEHKYSVVTDELSSYERFFVDIKTRNISIDALFYLWSLEDDRFIQDSSAIVYIFTAMANVKLTTKKFIISSGYRNEIQRCYLNSWIGFERSLSPILSNTQIAVIVEQLSDIQSELEIRRLLGRLVEEVQLSKLHNVLYKENKRYTLKINETSLSVGNSEFKPGGTYIITGGCGGLGIIFAKHIAMKHPVNFILVGRSPIDTNKQSQIMELENIGSKVFYMQADICDKLATKNGVELAKAQFGSINGVIHAAGIEIAEPIFKKDIKDFQKVFNTKAKGALILDEILKKEPLDFVFYFSSSASILGDFGSCDYSMANRFLDAYANYRNKQMLNGKTFVVNWPLWEEGGMNLGGEEQTKMYLKSSGQQLLKTKEGLDIFETILSQDKTQNLILVGQRDRIYRFLGLLEEKHLEESKNDLIYSKPGKGRRVEMKGFSVEQCIEWELKELISQVIKIPREKLDRDENLADFGFDSITLGQLAISLTNFYEIEVAPTLFYGYSTIEKVTEYFLQEYNEVINKFYRDGTPVEALINKKVIKPKLQVKEQKVGIENISQDRLEPIAIIGMSGRFPEARNIDELWTILEEGKFAVNEIPEDRFNWKDFIGDPSKEPGKINCKYLGAIPGVKEFDPLFFEISPKEAENMDPRQRLLMQEAWKALEDAGYGEKQIENSKIGIFVGAEQGDYQMLVRERGGITSSNNAILAARLAYFLNLDGPVMTIDTACSSGLVAAHQACLSLRNNECDTAIAAGVNLMLTPEMFVGISQTGMFTSDGKCFAFDKRANGMVPGEAIAVVVLKRLSQAQKDGDPIYGIIKGSGINYDGKTNGITAPSSVSQAKLLKTIYEQYKINPGDIDYIVTHGTGTRLGDPVEINALNDAFKSYTNKQKYCAITSTKTNFGHTFAASGLLSLISLVQAFRHGVIPASLHCEQESEYINWNDSPFYVNKSKKLLNTDAGNNFVGAVSAFGMSGTNAHMVVENYNEQDESIKVNIPPYFIISISAKTQEALDEKINDLVRFLQNKELSDNQLIDISYTLFERRQHFNHRIAVVVQDIQEAVYLLNQSIGNNKLPNLFKGNVPRSFTGQKALHEYGEKLIREIQLIESNYDEYKEMLYGLADLYCQGYELSWEKLYEVYKPKCLRIPTYPFSKEKYWIDKGNREKNNISLSNKNNVDNSYYENLINQVMNDTLSISDASKIIKNLY